MAKQTITAIAIGNGGTGSNYKDKEREKLKNILNLSSLFDEYNYREAMCNTMVIYHHVTWSQAYGSPQPDQPLHTSIHVAN